MSKTRFLLEGITALEITLALLIETHARHDPELVRRFIRSLDSVLDDKRLSPGTRENLEALRAAFRSGLDGKNRK